MREKDRERAPVCGCEDRTNKMTYKADFSLLVKSDVVSTSAMRDIGLKNPKRLTHLYKVGVQLHPELSNEHSTLLRGRGQRGGGEGVVVLSAID